MTVALTTVAGETCAIPETVWLVATMQSRDRLHKAAHLVNILRATRAHHPNFTVLLGAGASVESGIRTGAQMVQQWRKEYHRIHGAEEAFDEFVEQQSWFEATEEYSVLFESLYDQPSQRREFIEECVEPGSPSWGYIYLVDMIRRKTFNTVFTTNFDDLMNEACYLFSTDVRPIVCAHD